MATVLKATGTNGSSASAAFYPASGHVEVDSAGVHVDATFVHPDIVRYAEEGGLGLDEVGNMQTLLVAGIAASRSAGAYALVSEARQAAEGILTVLGSEAEGHIRAALKKAVGQDGEDGAFLPEVERIVTTSAKSIESQALRLTRELTGGGDTALPQIIEKRVRAAAADVVDTILKAALASDGPLGVHLAHNADGLKELRADLVKLQELFVHAQAATEQVDPAAAGREWQPAVIADVSRLCLVTGDRVEETGDQPAHGRSKKGDAVLYLAGIKADPQPKIVIECRTGKERVTMADLKKAKENRSAEAALLLVDNAHALPKDAEELGFRAYWDERSVVLHHDSSRLDSGILLATALQVTRMFAQLASASSKDEIDHELLRASLGRLERAVTRLKPLRASATGIETEVNRIRGYAQEIENDLRGSLGELTGLAAAA